MSIDRLRAHYGFTRMPFGNYADGAAMPMRCELRFVGGLRDLLQFGIVVIRDRRGSAARRRWGCSGRVRRWRV